MATVVRLLDGMGHVERSDRLSDHVAQYAPGTAAA
jgi:hypothetical protein